MPLTKSGSERAFKSNVSTLMKEVGKSPKVQSKDQALAIAYDIKRRGKADGGVVKSPIFRAADLERTPVEINPDLAFDPFARAAFRQRASVRRAAGGPAPMPAVDDPGPLHEGPVVSDVPGRTDKHNIRVKAGSYVLPSSHVASLAQDNTIGGFSVLDKMFKKQPGTPAVIKGPRGPNRKRRAWGGGLFGGMPGTPATSPTPAPTQPTPQVSPSTPTPQAQPSSPQWGQAQQAFAPITQAVSPYMQQMRQAFSPVHQAFQQAGFGNFRGFGGAPWMRRADGGEVLQDIGEPVSEPSGDEEVPIIVAGGEYILNPEQVMEVGGGDIKRGHEILDAWVKRQRKSQISTLRKLPGPAKA